MQHPESRTHNARRVPKHPSPGTAAATLNKNRYTRVIEKARQYWFLRPVASAIFIALQHTHSYFANAGELEQVFKNHLKRDRPSIVISTGGPFIAHRIAARYKRRFGYKLIADYRDPWSNNEILTNKSFFHRAIAFLDTAIERRTSIAYDHLIAVSDHQRDAIVRHIGFNSANASTMYNGFDSQTETRAIKNAHFTILFSGTFYATQPLEDILASICDLLRVGALPKNIEVQFLGAAASRSTTDRINAATTEFPRNFVVAERVKYPDAQQKQANAHLLVMPTHIGMKGIPSSKLFDYLYTRNPILAYPNDSDIIEKILTETRLGLVCDSREGMRRAIAKVYKAFKDNVDVVTPDQIEIARYSREQQTNTLISIANKLSDGV